MKITLYNTRGKKLGVFTPIQPGIVKMYTCGPTVYSRIHIGNFRAFTVHDILRRMFEFNGFKVIHVMNITDVGHLTSDADTGEDKMIKAAEKERITAWEIAKKYETFFLNDMQRLNINIPPILCRATGHIQEMINLIKRLEERGYTYIIPEDGLYFDTSKFPEYGKWANLDLKGLKGGARIDIKGKKNPTDFALWKFSPKDKKRDMEWESPWGIGFPGWHIECSAMSIKYLGEHFDLHGGGVDHIPVHHTNEIAQSEAATGKSPWVNYWFHVAFLNLREGKMSKSRGNIVTLDDMVNHGFDPLALRYFYLTAHYRNPIEFSFEALRHAQNSYNRLKERIRELRNSEKEVSSKTDKYRNKFLSQINQDLYTPGALAVLWEMIKDKELTNGEKYNLALEFDKVLGLKLEKIKEEKIDVTEEIKRLIEQREEYRRKQMWKEADKIRAEVKQMGLLIEDTPEGPKLKKLKT